MLFFSFLLSLNNKWGVDLLTFYNNFIKLCAKNKKSPSGVASEVGLSRTSPNGWKKGKQPSEVNLQKLADYFNVSVEYLKGEEDTKKSPDKLEELTEGERVWLNLYNQLSADTRGILVDIATKFENLPTETQQFLLGAVRVALNNQK